MKSHARVVIIGGGAMGIGLAYHLGLEGWGHEKGNWWTQCQVSRARSPSNHSAKTSFTRNSRRSLQAIK